MRHRHATGAPDRLTKLGMGQAKARQHPAPAWASQLGAKPGHPELGASSVPLLQRGCSGEGGDRQSPQHSSKHRPLGTGPGAVLLPGAWSPCPGLCRVWPLALQSSTGGSPGHRSAVLQGPGAVPHAEQGWGPWGLWRWTRCSTGAGLQALHPPYGAPIPQWAKGSGSGVLAVRAAQGLLLVPLHLHRTRHEAEFALQLAGGFPQHCLRVGAGVWGWQGPTISPIAPSPALGAV